MGGFRRAALSCAILLTTVQASNPAAASETVTYAYDARGRLVKVSRSGTVNNGQSACYAYDKADNRNNVTVNLSSECSPASLIGFSINDVAVTEGGNLVFTVTKAGSTSQSLLVTFATANGTATAGSDYTATSGTLTFAAGDATKTITVATTDDASAESAETIFVNLTSASGGASISDSQGIGTINDNDSVQVATFSISDATEVEGETAVFTVTRSGLTSTAVGVSYATANNTALAGVGYDYNAVSGTLSFAANETTKTISVFLRPDINVEGTETFYVNLSSPTGGATITDGQGIGTILDDPPAEQCYDENGQPIPCDFLVAPPPESATETSVEGQ